MEKNKDYTFIVRNVKPEHQSSVTAALTALQSVLNVLNVMYTTILGVENSPEPEQWIVEYFGFGNTWKRSKNPATKDVFNSRQEAESAIGIEVDGFQYRARRIDRPEPESEPEQWVIQRKGINGWTNSVNFPSLPFSSKEAAIKAFGMRLPSNGMAYRVARVGSEEANSEVLTQGTWVVEFRLRVRCNGPAIDKWVRAADHAVSGKFSSLADAWKAINNYKPYFGYRPKRIK